MTKFATYGVLKVAKLSGTTDQPLSLTFVEPAVMADAESKLRALGYEIVDSSPAYKLTRSVDDALESVEFWCGKPGGGK